MGRKRYNISLSRPIVHKFEHVAGRHREGKSALIEEALKALLEPQAFPGVADALAHRLDHLNRTVARLDRDQAITSETLALFVRYFLTITPPLPESEQEPARLLGRERFEQFVAEVGRRLATDRRLVREVLESITSNEPDAFATSFYGASGDPAEKTADGAAKPEGDAAEPEGDKDD